MFLVSGYRVRFGERIALARNAQFITKPLHRVSFFPRVREGGGGGDHPIFAGNRGRKDEGGYTLINLIIELGRESAGSQLSRALSPLLYIYTSQWFFGDEDSRRRMNGRCEFFSLTKVCFRLGFIIGISRCSPCFLFTEE